ncbi:MAG: hypothetical protein IT285_06940 [Bdellovibrionales bacterium]|nr:hypothetical protein [Bdellovibrionales bacterium]
MARMDAVMTAAVTLCALVVLSIASGCSSIGLGPSPNGGAGKGVIENPFLDTAWIQKQSQDRVVFRTKKGHRSLEVELPGDQPEFQDFMVPLTPQFAESIEGGEGRRPASLDADGVPMDQSYTERKPTATDLEIVNRMPQGNPADDRERQEIEQGLGLRPVEDPGPRGGTSYLASLDKVKQLFRLGRYEAGLLETDALLRSFPTDPRLYEMRGTLLDRLGYRDLAIRSWQQSVKLDPNNLALKAYLERKSDQSKWRKVSSE